MRWMMVILLPHALFAQDHAQKLSSAAQKGALTISPSSLPGYEGDAPTYDIGEVEAQTAMAFEDISTARHLRTTAESRPFFKIDPERDPLIRHSLASTTNPQTMLASPLHNRMPDPQFTLETCEEGAPLHTVTCSKTLVPPTFTVTPARYSNWWCTSGDHGPDDPRCRAKRYYSPARMVTPERINATEERWTSTCGTLEARTTQGLCRLIKKVCPQGQETRALSGTMGGTSVTRSITRPCWRYEFTYACGHPDPSPCQMLLDRGCEQINSECIQKSGDLCMRWKQTFRCGPVSKTTPLQLPVYGSMTIIPLPKSLPQTGLNEALSKLQLLKEVQDDLRAQNTTSTLPLIFKGLPRACTIAFAGFKNCCTDGKGWGVSLGLAGCGAEDKDLSHRQEKGLCHIIGTYCAEKVLGVCIRKKKRSCCFPTKLARLLQVQGRAQLGISWGTPENPDCRGLTADEIARVNFDRLDLREAFQDLASRIAPKPCPVVTRNLQTSLHNMTSICPNTKGAM